MKLRRHVVVVGGGFGGLGAARALSRAPVRITLLDRKNHHLFQPLLYQVAMAGLAPGEVAVPIRGVLRLQQNVRVLLSDVMDIDLEHRLVHSREAASLAELAESIYWEAEQYIPFDIQDVNLDYQILDPGTGPNSQGTMEVLLVAAKKDKIADYTSVITQAGRTPVIVDVDAFALQNAYEVNYGLDASSVVVLLNAGASAINVNILAGGQSVHRRPGAVAEGVQELGRLAERHRVQGIGRRALERECPAPDAPGVQAESQAGSVASGPEDPRGILDERQRVEDAQAAPRDVADAAQRVADAAAVIDRLGTAPKWLVLSAAPHGAAAQLIDKLLPPDGSDPEDLLTGLADIEIVDRGDNILRRPR